MARTIQSPGVEIKEFDLSENPSPAIGTYTFTAGFADKGPTDEILQVTSLEEFEQIYGAPTTPAERYFYHSVAQQFNSPVNVLVGRMPYGYENGEGFSVAKKYSALVYPVATYKTAQKYNFIENTTLNISAGYYKITQNGGPDLVVSEIKDISPYMIPTAALNVEDLPENESIEVGKQATVVIEMHGATINLANQLFTTNEYYSKIKDDAKYETYKKSICKLTPMDVNEVFDVKTSSTFSGANEYIINQPKHFELTEDQYLSLQEGIKWKDDSRFTGEFKDLGKAGIIIINKAQTTINDQYEGYYVGIADNMAMEPSSKYQSILNAYTVAGSSLADNVSVYSEIPSTRMNFTLSANSGDIGDSISQIMENTPSFDIFGSEFDDTLVFNIFKLRKSIYAESTIKLDAVLSESYTASVDYFRQIQAQNGGQATSFFIEKKAEDSADVQIMINPFLSNKKEGKSWLDDNGKPTKKIRVAFDVNKNTEFYQLDDETKATTQQKNNQFNVKYANRYGLPYSYIKLSGDDKGEAADALFALGVYQESKANKKVLGSIPNKLTRILSKIDNRDLFELDITVEAGLGTIWSYYKEDQYNWLNDLNDPISAASMRFKVVSGSMIDEYKFATGDDGEVAATNEDFREFVAAHECEFNDESMTVYATASAGLWFKTGQDAFDGNGGEDAEMIINYRTINNAFINFAQNERKDHMHICDPLRFIFIQGANKKTLSDRSKNFSQHIYWPLRYQFMTANTSYAATYGNWAKVYDAASDDNIWIPMSGVLASVYGNTDSNFYCWYAPAGPDRGVLTTVSDIAFSPALKQRDQMYKISINPIYQDPNMGFVVFGQKTLQSKPSSFDRINVRRLFLYLEKSTYNTIKWFLFRNNTYSTRTAIINTLDPIFRSVLNNEGMYDYRIVCDANNNTPDVIDANELVVDIYIKAARTAEFILCNFYSTKTSTNFDELIK